MKEIIFTSTGATAELVEKIKVKDGFNYRYKYTSGYHNGTVIVFSDQVFNKFVRMGTIKDKNE